MRAIWIILAAGGLGCSSPDAPPCETQSSAPLAVTVLDPSGTVACDATVTATQSSRTVDLALTSGSPCDYEGLYGETGTWTITAKRAGHADATANVSLAASPTGACADQPPAKRVSVTPQLGGGEARANSHEVAKARRVDYGTSVIRKSARTSNGVNAPFASM